MTSTQKTTLPKVIFIKAIFGGISALPYSFIIMVCKKKIEKREEAKLIFLLDLSSGE